MRDAPRATNNLGSASRARPPPSPPTATTSSLGPREPITGRVSDSLGRGEGNQNVQYLREGVGGSMWPSTPTCSLPWSPGALPRFSPQPCQHAHERGHRLSSAWPRVPQHAGMSSHMPSRGPHAPTHQPTPHHSHSHLRTLPLAGLTLGECDAKSGGPQAAWAGRGWR